MFKGGVIFVDDHATGFVDVCHQVSLDPTETIKSKVHYEKEAYHDGVKVQAYHTDNGIFTSKKFLEELIGSAQKVRFSGAWSCRTWDPRGCHNDKDHDVACCDATWRINQARALASGNGPACDLDL